MLKNKNKYTSLRFKQFTQGFLYSFVAIFLPRKKRIIFNSSYNNNFNFNSKYLFLYYLKQKKNTEVFFVINDKSKRHKLIAKHGPYFISNMSIKEKLFILKSSIWITSTMETPILGVLFRFRRYVINLSHGIVFKNAGISEKNTSILKSVYYFLIRSNFTHFLATSENLRAATAKVYGTKIENILITGMPRNDVIKQATREKRSFLYAPTWRPSSIQYPLPCLPEEEELLIAFLEKNNILLYIRHHPYFELDEHSSFSSSSILNFNSSVCLDLSLSLNKFQGIISDYSSLFIDALLLDTSLAFYNYDQQLFEQEVGFLFNYYDYTPGPKVNSLQGLKNYFLSSLEYKPEQSRENIKNFFFDDTSGRYSEKLSDLIDSK